MLIQARLFYHSRSDPEGICQRGWPSLMGHFRSTPSGRCGPEPIYRGCFGPETKNDFDCRTPTASTGLACRKLAKIVAMSASQDHTDPLASRYESRPNENTDIIVA